MNQGAKTIIFPVRDLAKAKALYAELLGVAPQSDAPYYVGFEVAGQQIGLDPNGHAQGMTGPVVFFHVDDIKAEIAGIVAGGGSEDVAPRDVGGGRLVARVRDGDGNVFGLIQG
jgi:predicted enzyme related to lactoylglutathione lyase